MCSSAASTPIPTNTLFSPADVENLVQAFEDPERCRPEFDRFLFDLEDGEVLEVDFTEIESADEIRNDPRKVLPAPDGGEDIELMNWCGQKMAFVIYNWRPLYLQSVLSCVEDLERDGWEIAWLGWPETSAPPIGRRFREIQDEHFAKPEVKAEIRKATDERDSRKAMCGDFSFLDRMSRKDRLITNEDRTIPPMDGGYPPADPVDVAKNTLGLFRGGIMAIGDELAVVQRKTETFAMTSPEQLFAFLYQWTQVDWNAGRTYLQKKEFQELLRQIAPAYHQVDRLPHWPKLDGHLYLCDFPQGVGGEAVEGLLDFFCFATEADRHLCHALLATLISGMPPGTRPAWVISSPAGRGVGKTTLAAKVAELFGGSIDVSLNEDMGVIKQRLLTPEASGVRVVLADNLKSFKLSSADWEGAITSRYVSGKRMYKGERRRENYFTWILTLNASSLSKDLAQRTITIELDEPKRSGDWEERLSRYIQDRRDEIIRDLLDFFKRPLRPLKRYSRWATWQREILCRFPDAEDIQRIISSRQASADVEDEEAGVVVEHFRESLEALHYYTDREQIFIPSRIASEWMSDALREKLSTIGASRRLAQWISEGTVERIQKNRTNAWGKGFVWFPSEIVPDSPILTDLEERMARYRTDRTDAF